MDTKLVELIVKPSEKQAFKPFKLNAYMKKKLECGCRHTQHYYTLRNIPAPGIPMPYNILLWKHRDDTWTGFISRHLPVRVLHQRGKWKPFAVHLPIDWILSGPLPAFSGMVSTCLNANMDQDFELSCQVKFCYDMELYGALNQVELRFVADARALENLENTTVHSGKSYKVGMLWAQNNFELPNN